MCLPRTQPACRPRLSPLDGDGFRFLEGSDDVLCRQKRERQQLPDECVCVAHCQVGRAEAQPQHHTVEALGPVEHAAAQDDSREHIS